MFGPISLGAGALALGAAATMSVLTDDLITERQRAFYDDDTQLARSLDRDIDRNRVIGLALLGAGVSLTLVGGLVWWRDASTTVEIGASGGGVHIKATLP